MGAYLVDEKLRRTVAGIKRGVVSFSMPLCNKAGERSYARRFIFTSGVLWSSGREAGRSERN
jgi:hypothetical protein